LNCQFAATFAGDVRFVADKVAKDSSSRRWLMAGLILNRTSRRIDAFARSAVENYFCRTKGLPWFWLPAQTHVRNLTQTIPEHYGPHLQ
jgi:hypothetical protein